MNNLQLELTRLIGKKKRLYEWEGDDSEMTISPATLSDFHRWMNEKVKWWEQCSLYISHDDTRLYIPYDSSKDLLEQSDDTLKQIIELISSNQ